MKLTKVEKEKYQFILNNELHTIQVLNESKPKMWVLHTEKTMIKFYETLKEFRNEFKTPNNGK